jgi:hypothetical protein
MSGFAPFFGGMARKTIGVGALMAYTSVVYISIAGLMLYAILKHFQRDHQKAEQRTAQES